jgi:hypothetical protein
VFDQPIDERIIVGKLPPQEVFHLVEFRGHGRIQIAEIPRDCCL